MKSMRLNRRTYKTITLEKGRKKKETLEKMVREIYNLIPNRYTFKQDGKVFTVFKSTIESDSDRTIKTIANQIWYDNRGINVYNAFSQLAKSTARAGRLGTKYDLWRKFRTDPETSPVYNKFNSYMYRNGYSASQYWFNNAEITIDKSTIYATCNLPAKTKGVRYDTLEIEFDYSGPNGQQIYAYFTY